MSPTLFSLSTFPPRPPTTVDGTLVSTAPGVLGITFSFVPFTNISTTYAGAIELFTTCRLAIGGTYTTEQIVGVAGPGGIDHHVQGPIPFSGRVIQRPPIHPGD